MPIKAQAQAVIAKGNVSDKNDNSDDRVITAALITTAVFVTVVAFIRWREVAGIGIVGVWLLKFYRIALG